MRHFIAFLLFYCIIGNATATDNGEYDYTINSMGEVTINKYTKTPEDNIIIIPKFIEDKPVTTIKRIFDSKNYYNVSKIFIPYDIQTTEYKLTQNLLYLQCGVIDEDFRISDVGFPFYYTDINSDNCALKCIYTFGGFKYAAKDITGNGCTRLFHLGSIVVKYSDNYAEEIQMYNWGQDFPTRALVDQTRFEYLIWALEQHLVYKDYSLADIKEIDLTNLQNKPSANTEVNIDFGNYDPSSALNYGAKVIVSSNKEYEHTLKDNEIISITDLQDYTLPFIDTNTTIHYTRSNTKDWNSVCLPFVLHESDFPEDSNTKIYTISGADEERIKLTHVESVAAGEPCFICSKAENWNLSLTDREIKSTTQAGITEIEGWKMFGSFQEAEIGAGKFKLDSDGKSIGQTATNEARVYPFRCYLECTSTNGAPERFMVDIEGEEQSITFTEKDDEASDTFYFDLSGRRIQNTSEPRLIKGRNIIIR